MDAEGAVEVEDVDADAEDTWVVDAVVEEGQAFW